MARQQKSMRSEEMSVTPEIARTWLDTMARNRSPKRAVVARYAEDIRAGRWRLTHQGPAFDADGRLIDGQHRLLAVIAAGTSVRMLVTWGVDARGMDGIDVGVNRDGRDVAVIVGATDHPVQATWVRSILVALDHHPTPAEVADVLPRLRPSLDAMLPIFGGHRGGACRAGFAAAFVIAHVRIGETATALARRYVLNDGLTAWSGLWHIRRRSADGASGGSTKTRLDIVFALRCIEIEMVGEPRKHVRGEPDLDAWFSPVRAAKVARTGR